MSTNMSRMQCGHGFLRVIHLPQTAGRCLYQFFKKSRDSNWWAWLPVQHFRARNSTPFIKFLATPLTNAKIVLVKHFFILVKLNVLPTPWEKLRTN